MRHIHTLYESNATAPAAVPREEEMSPPTAHRRTGEHTCLHSGSTQTQKIHTERVPVTCVAGSRRGLRMVVCMYVRS